MSTLVNPAGSPDGLPEIDGLSQYIDLKDGLGRIRGNRRVYKTLLQSFVDNIGIEELDQEIRDGTLEAAAKTAHGIKGVCANLSLIAAAQSAKALEARLKEGISDGKAFGEFAADFERTKELAKELIQKL